MLIKFTNPKVEDHCRFDIEEHIEMAALDVMNYIQSKGSISITEYNQACKHYRVNRSTLQTYTHPYSYWCMSCSLIVTSKEWDQVDYKCKACSKKYYEKMKGFVMQRSWEKPEKIDVDDVLSAVKYASNYEADLFLNGKLIMSCLGLSHSENAEVLKDYGIVRYYKNNSLRWKYEDETRNVIRYFASSYGYTSKDVRKAHISVHDYKAFPRDQEFSSFEEVKAHAEKLFAKGYDELVMTCWIEGESSTLKYKEGEGWVKGWV